MLRHRSLTKFLFILMTACLISPGVRAADVAYKLGAGDKIHVTVYNEQDLSGDYDVSDQGGLALPLIGQVIVGGKTTSEAETIIAGKYGANYLVNPRVSVQVLNYRPFFILGEVKNPGSYPYQSGMTVLNAVALAGGYTPRANKSGIKIKHTNDSSAEEQSIDENGSVFPGDVVRVGEWFF